MPAIFSNAPRYKNIFVFYERFIIHTFLWATEIALVTAAVSASQRYLLALGLKQLCHTNCMAVPLWKDPYQAELDSSAGT